MKAFIWVLVVTLAASSLAKKEETPDDRDKRGIFGEQVLGEQIFQANPGLQTDPQDAAVEQPTVADLYSAQNLQTSNLQQSAAFGLPSAGFRQQVVAPLSLQSAAPLNLQHLSLQSSAARLQTVSPQLFHVQGPQYLRAFPLSHQSSEPFSQYSALNLQAAPFSLQEVRQNFDAYPLSLNSVPLNERGSILNQQYESSNLQSTAAPLNYSPRFQSVPLAVQNVPLNSQYAPLSIQATSHSNSLPVSVQSSSLNQYSPLNLRATHVNAVNLQVHPLSQGVQLNTQYAPLNAHYAPVNSPYAAVSSQYSQLNIAKPANHQASSLNFEPTPVSFRGPLNIQPAPINLQPALLNLQPTPLNLQPIPLNLQPAPLSLQAPLNLQKQYIPSNSLYASLNSQRAPLRFSTPINEVPSTLHAPVQSLQTRSNFYAGDFSNYQTPLIGQALPVATSPVNFRPQAQPLYNQVPEVAVPSYGPAGPGYTNIQALNPVPYQSYAPANSSPLLHSGIGSVQKEVRVQKIVKVPVTVNVGYVSKVVNDQKYVRVEPSVEIPVQNPVSAELRYANPW